MSKWPYYYKVILVFTVITIILVTPKLVSAYEKGYKDVNKSQTFYEPIMKLTKNGVINGYGDGTFRSYEELQRRHGAVLFYNALRLSTPSNVEGILEKYYIDVFVGGSNAEQIAAVTPDIFKGSGGKFYPFDYMTREEMATTFVRAFGLRDKGTNPGINLTNVSATHQNDVRILAQYKITKQTDDFKPREPITRGEFAAFLYRAMNIKQDTTENSFVGYTRYNFGFVEVINTQMTKTPKVDGAGRFLASRELVEYYANPNNFSKEAPEFYQFLLLSYSDGLSESEINEKILKGKGSLEGTAGAFIKAGRQYNVNVIYLIAHALHETGNGTSDLSTGYPVSIVDGKQVSEKKTYNMFGINAFDSCPLRCGSEYSYKQGWFTKEAAILGGAQFINNGYIGDGQDTLYKMRWNPENPGTHQYATHVSWATIQARNIQKMYELYNLLDSYILRFEVPVYNNQPSSSQKPTGDDQYVVDTSVSGWIGTTTANLNLREAPSTSYSIITTLTNGTKVHVIGQNGGWFKVNGNNKIGWVSGDYVDFENLLKVVNLGGSTLNVRSNPTTDSAILGSLQNNDIVIGAVDKDGNFVKNGAWYNIIFNGKSAWVHGDYIKIH